jgi:lipopolysaccharide/colanic/teichoic acid biosynthesis glycosyltransferase
LGIIVGRIPFFVIASEMIYRDLIKPLGDKVAALLVLLLTLPLMLPVVLLLYFANRGKPFFLQTRPGLHGDPFRIVKLRTMTDERDANGVLLPDEQRLHRIGALVRKSSLDEIPQLINVLKGDMSIVGPRPLLMEYLPLYSREQSRRHEVRPGITGWAQVNGRNAISWQQKFSYDVWYVDHLGFGLDMKILFLTVKKVLRSDGISGTDTVTMTKFEGNI